MDVDLSDWFWEIPTITRLYFAGSFLLTVATALDLVSPFSLYFNSQLIFTKGQVWRLLTNFMFFGPFGIDFLFHMYFLVRYSRSLEEGSFRGKPADFVFFLIFGAVFMTMFAPFVNILFLGSSLTFMMVYVWGRRNPMQRMAFLGLFPFTAPYLPWVLLGFSMMLGSPAIVVDVIGIIVGHVYFYLEDVLPAVAESRGWKFRRVLHTPAILHILCGTYRATNGQAEAGINLNNVALDLPEVPVAGPFDAAQNNNNDDNNNNNDALHGEAPPAAPAAAGVDGHNGHPHDGNPPPAVGVGNGL